MYNKNKKKKKYKYKNWMLKNNLGLKRYNKIKLKSFLRRLFRKKSNR